jgi:photosystem II stability/assembly factor-like uncharacterized protein
VTRRLRRAIAGALVTALCAVAAAHDPGHRGGLFRSTDGGAHWRPASPGIFTSAAFAVALGALDPPEVLLATEGGLWQSRNGGRDWDIVARDALREPARAVAIERGGDRMLVATDTALLRGASGRWTSMRAPRGALPPVALAAGATRGRVYLAGTRGLFRSDDWGESWTPLGTAAEGAPIRQVAVRHDGEGLVAIMGGTVRTSPDGGATWHARMPPSGPAIEAVGLDAESPSRVWAACAGQVLVSDDDAALWRPVGRAIPEQGARAAAIAVSGETIVMATDHGLFRSADRGERWTTGTSELPAHLAVAVLVRDLREPATLYAAFAAPDAHAAAKRAAGVGSRGGEAGAWVGAAAVGALGAAAVAWQRRRRRAPPHGHA